MTNDEVQQAMQFLNDSWPHKPLSPATMVIWGQQLVAFDNSDVMRVLLDLARTSEWRPSLATILKPLEGSAGGETAEEGYASVCTAFRRGEGRRAEYLSDRTRKAVQHMGGWPAIGRMVDWPTWGRKNFIAAYESAEAVSVDRQRSALSSGPVRALVGGE